MPPPGVQSDVPNHDTVETQYQASGVVLVVLLLVVVLVVVVVNGDGSQMPRQVSYDEYGPIQSCNFAHRI